jgi:hypothetical protein
LCVVMTILLAELINPVDAANCSEDR